VDLLAEFLPKIDGFLPLVFFLLLTGLTGLVGLFAAYVIAQQFRNPGRRDRRP
jgi:hypothetical protein